MGEIDSSLTKQTLKKYQAQELNLEQLSTYQKWALPFFHDRQILQDPNLEITLQVELNDLESLYEKMGGRQLASFTAFLSWKLLQAMQVHQEFRWRCLEGKWYRFDGLPLFFPVAVGGAERFKEVMIPQAGQLDWPSFAEKYQAAVQEVKEQADQSYHPLLPIEWSVAHFIGNLPKLRFTSLSIHKPTEWMGRPMFYFGERYRQGGNSLMPLWVRFDHTNTDPFLLQQLVQTFLK